MNQLKWKLQGKIQWPVAGHLGILNQKAYFSSNNPNIQIDLNAVSKWKAKRASFTCDSQDQNTAALRTAS